MTTVQPKTREPIKNDNLKNLKPMNGKGTQVYAAKTHAPADISETAKTLNATQAQPTDPTSSPEAAEPPSASMKAEQATSTATNIAKTLAKIPVLPITVPSESKDAKKLEEKISDNFPPKLSFIKKPALIFIEGFSAFGISNGDGIKDMADNLPGAKRFSWDEQDKIVDEIKKHAPDQPVVLVGHSFGGDSAVEIANTLNSVKNGFRGIDLLVSIDSVGMNNTIIPMNVKRNLNFIGEGVVPFLHGTPDIARNTDYTEIVNELRSELHSKMDDSKEVQFKIFESINDVLAESNHQDIFIEIQTTDELRKIIDKQMPHHLKD
ncbi:MAG: hypothetical protein PHY93_06160 [Bacteriovorax sp.]|nr:hypothetical protein [Bacteriovorax sp.]